jgi:hypothetical protein
MREDDHSFAMRRGQAMSRPRRDWSAVLADYAAGMKLDLIAAEHGVYASQIPLAAARAGIPLRGPRRRNWKPALADCAGGVPYRIITTRHQGSERYLRALARRAGIPARHRCGRSWRVEPASTAQIRAGS